MKIRAHETFTVRRGWLHKGVKNIIKHPRLFTDKELNPCKELGIGANMVKSLRYWMTTFGIMSEVQEGNQRIQRLTQLGEIIDKYDKYYEEDSTLWLLHYKLATNKENATAWYWFFNIFRANSFDKSLFLEEISDYLKTQYNYAGSSKMLEDEFNCLMRTYYSKDKEENPESTTICPLVELGLLECDNGEYRKRTPDGKAINPLIFYAALRDQYEKDEILISDLIEKQGSVGKIFNLDKGTLFYLLDQLEKSGYLRISRTAGLDIVYIQEKKSFYDIVSLYYQKILGVEDYE